MIEPLKSSNGAAPCIPVIRDPGLLTGPPMQHRGREPGTRLRIFSGTANPALAQVNHSCSWHLFPFFFFFGTSTCLLYGW